MAAVEAALDAEQEEAAHIDADVRQVVIAGPGAGKTETVSALVAWLAEEEGVDPSEEILVLSFSNAAVHAVGRRLRHLDGPSPEIRTVDSLAREVILDLFDDDLPANLDRRIAVATRLLRDEHWDRLDGLAHVIVDEVQDVVGARAEFVLELLRRIPSECGFSLLGDPAQGIYDFQLTDKASMPSSELLSTAAQLGDVRQVVLRGQYRARSREAVAAVSLRDDVLAGDPFDATGGRIASTVPGGEVEQVAPLAIRWGGTTAFLTRDNGEALLVAGALAAAGFPVELRRPAHAQVSARWIAESLADHPSRTIDRETFLAAHPHGDGEDRWRALRRVAGGYAHELEISRVAAALRTPRRLPPELLAEPVSDIVVSTVHRSKGLEYDNVVLVDPRVHRRADESPAAEARVRYVALTRSRDRIVRAAGEEARHVYRDGRTGRWIRGGYKKWQTFGFEVRHGDIDVSAPPPGGDTTQRHLAEAVTPGAPVDLELAPALSTLDVPRYSIRHHGTLIGHTSEEFGEALAHRIGHAESRVSKGQRPWPRLADGRVAQVTTAAGLPRADGPTGRHGLWLAPALTGLLTLKWKDDDDD